MRFLFLILLTLTLSACAGIDRGLYSLSDSVAPVDRVTGQRSLNVTSRPAQISQSNLTGDQLLQEYYRAGKDVNEKVDAAQYARLERIFDRVHAVSHLGGERWAAFLLPDDDWNAFTNGGTYIFIYKGLMNDLKSDDELAAVIGHEIGHVTANHIYEQKAYVMASSLSGSKGATKTSFRTAFTVTQEEEADRLGVLYAALAGYDPYAAARVWKKIYDKHGDMLSNHPTNSRRSQVTESWAQKYSKYYRPGKVNPDPTTVFNELAGANSAQTPPPGEGGGLSAVLETVGSVLTERQQAKDEQQSQRQIAQFTQYVRQSMFLTGRQITDAHTLRAEFSYRGQYPAGNLNFAARFGREDANAHTPDIIAPGSTLTVIFRFDSDLRAVNPSDIQLGIIHAEPR